MTASKDRLDAKIRGMLEKQQSAQTIARRLILFDFSQVFSGDEERGFSILNEVANRFMIPFSAVKIVGSGQFGYSYFSRRDFTPKVSDLDLAIVSAALFQEYSEHSYLISEGYTKQIDFPLKKGISQVSQFREYLGSGYFRPDMMPNGSKKDTWFRFFNQLSNKHTNLFRNINGGIFLSESFLEMRNSNLTKEYGKDLNK